MNSLIAQTQNPAPELTAIKLSLNTSGTHYIQATLLNQTWVRFTENNPGTKIDGSPAEQTFDIGLRRTRLQLFGQITDKVFVYFQFGQNNFNTAFNSTGNRKLAPFFHDALCEYNVLERNELKLGAGLTIANGLSRFSQPSIGTIMSMDVPVFAQATVDQTDEFSRKLSIYARGQIGQLDYRVVLSDPFPITSNGASTPAISNASSFAVLGREKQVQGYFIWQFFDHEAHTTPYMAGTYLGKKKVFNIAAGFITQKNAMWRTSPSGDTVRQDMNLLAVESFLDMPLPFDNGSAVNAYAGYFVNNYGDNYMRYNGIMNPATATSLSSATAITDAGPNYGNAFPMFGTGNVFYGQIGYLLPTDLTKPLGGFMVYVSAMLARYQRLESLPMNVVQAGVTWLIHGHSSKISLDWQNRPTYSIAADKRIEAGVRKNCFTLQYQIFF